MLQLQVAEAAVCGGMVCALTCGLFPGFIQSVPYGGERCLQRGDLRGRGLMRTLLLGLPDDGWPRHV